MSDGINPAMNHVKPSRADPSRSAPLADAGALELLERHNSMLPGCNTGDNSVRIVIGELPTHVGG
jgi:hypothetical protein